MMLTPHPTDAKEDLPLLGKAVSFTEMGRRDDKTVFEICVEEISVLTGMMMYHSIRENVLLVLFRNAICMYLVY